MGMSRLGIAIGRKAIFLVGVKNTAKGAHRDVRLRVPRERSDTAAEALRKVLAGLDPSWRRCEVRIALSPAFLACADLFEVPFRSEGQLQAVAAALAEGRCAGEGAEELAVDAIQVGSTQEGGLAEVVALSHKQLEALRSVVREALPDSTLVLLTSIPASAARTIEVERASRGFGLAANGDVVLWVPQDAAPARMRCFPCDGPAEVARLRMSEAANAMGLSEERLDLYVEGDEKPVPFQGGGAIEAEFASAWAAAQVDLARCPNVLHGARDVSKHLVHRLAQPLVVLAACAAMLLFAVGTYFHMQIRRSEATITRVEQQEEKLWAKCYPGVRYKPGSLVTNLKRTLADQQKATDANRAPSALAFWSEVAASMPNPDQLGMSLESLQLEPEGGRLTALVDAKAGDPLGNASALEHALNASERLSARGEFETKDNQVIVRMRLDFRPMRPAVTRTRLEVSNP